MKKPTIALVALIACLSGCKNKEETKILSTLRCGIPTDIVTLDPGKSNDVPSSTIILQCFEGLTRLNERGEAVSSLAEKIETLNDGKTYIFHIKKGIKFHNGDELTAQDFKWTFERNLNKNFNSPTALSFLGEIIGAKEYNKGEKTEVIGIKVINSHALQVDIEKPRGYFLSKLSFPVAFVLNHKTAPKTEITQVENCIGTGPFQLIEHQSKSYNKLKAHADYYNKKPNVDLVEYFVISDKTMIVNKIKKGALDIAEIDVSEINQLKQDNQYNKGVLEILTDSIFYLEFNSIKNNLFKNPKFRLAIAHAINQEEIVKEAIDNNAIAAHYFIPQNILGFRSGKGLIPFDINRAKQLLHETNIDPNKINIEITVPDRPLSRKVAENISIQLRHNLGITIKVQSLAWGTYTAKAQNKELPLRLAGWRLDYPDPNNLLTLLFDSTSTQNRCGFSNPAFDDLTRKADSIDSPQERATFYQKAEDILLEEGQIIPLYTTKNYWWISPKVKNLTYNSRGHLPYYKVSIEK